MTTVKDNFSTQSDKYAKYRPTYPCEFFTYLNSIVPGKQNAWDCGTGNGQVASELAKIFDNVFATDISQSQIDNALQADNIFYSIQPAEQTNFEDKLFDVIITAQAIHWFHFEKFYAEVKRTAKNNALFCILGYELLNISTGIDTIILDFYHNIIGKYWDKGRGYIDENYQIIPFPFDEIQIPNFVNIQNWTLPYLIGYINTWSAVKHFTKANGYNPVNNLQKKIEKVWGNKEFLPVHFPILLRIGRIKK